MKQNLLSLLALQQDWDVNLQLLFAAAQKLGFDAEYTDYSSLAEIKERMEKGEMIIVDWFSPEVCGHYSVVVELTDENITLANPHMETIR